MYKYPIDGIMITGYPSLSDAVEDIVTNYVGICSSATAVNPEKIMISRQDQFLRSSLCTSEICYPDGIGVVNLLNKKSGKSFSRIPGCELWESLMVSAADRQVPVFLIGGTPAVIDETVKKLKDTVCANIVGSSHGYFEDDHFLISQIINSGAKIVSVAMGSPRQELFIDKCRSQKIDAFFMGVGGTYDVYTGNVKRAPKLFRDNGFEWLYRLIVQPRRIFRQFNLIKFYFLSFFNKI